MKAQKWACVNKNGYVLSWHRTYSGAIRALSEWERGYRFSRVFETADGVCRHCGRVPQRDDVRLVKDAVCLKCQGF